MMGIRDKTKLLANSDRVKEEGENLLEVIVSAFSGDLISLKKVIEIMKTSPAFINQVIFYENFTAFLEGAFYSEEDLRRFSERLAEDGNKEEHTKRIVKIIDEIDTKKKAEYIVNLTRSLIAGFLNVSDYLRLCTIVKNIIIEDLEFLSKNLHKENLALTPTTLSLSNQGLMYMSVIGEECEYSFLALAEQLDKYGISYGDESKYRYGLTEKNLKESVLETSLNIPEVPKDEIDNILAK